VNSFPKYNDNKTYASNSNSSVMSEKYWSTLKEGNSRVVDYLLVWCGLCLKRSAPPSVQASLRSLTPSSRAWLLQYQWGGCTIPFDPMKPVAGQKIRKQDYSQVYKEHAQFRILKTVPSLDATPCLSPLSRCCPAR